MSALVTEGALDLSAKSCSTPPTAPSPKVLTSPVPSVMSEEQEDQERASSVSSAGSLGSPPPASHPNPLLVKPMAGPLPAFHLQPTAAVPSKSEEAQSPRGVGASMRPFKMYPFEPMTSMYSQLATQSALAAATSGLYSPGTLPGVTSVTSALPTGLPPMAMFDSSPVTLSSPITQYLQQRKRRQEARSSPGSSASLDASAQAMFGGDIHHMSSPASPGQDSSDSASSSAKKQRLSSEPGNTEERRDDAYWERRRKNNEAAKRSRDARRAKEEEIALRAAFLEQENLKLRAQVAILKNETAKLHYMLYNRL